MIKTSTLPQKTSSLNPKKAKKPEALPDDMGPSDFTIQSILNYSKALQVINISATAAVFGVMN
jgi:hypothetical protein